MLSDHLNLRIVGFLTSLKFIVGASDNLLLEEDVLIVAFVEVKSIDRVASVTHGFGNFG